MSEEHEPEDRGEGENEERPLGVFAALGWVGAAWFFAILVLEMSRSVRPGLRLDLVNNEVCVALGFSIATVLALWIHLPGRSLADGLGVRPTSPLLLALAALAGATLQVPVTLLSTAIETRFPRGQEELDLLAQLYAVPPGAYRIAFAVATVALGPLVEELLFRGVLFRGLSRRMVRLNVLLLVAFLFALIHLDLRKLAPIFLAGLLLGHLRERTGSIAASLVGHMSFNAITTFALLVGWAKMDDLQGPLHPGLIAGGSIGFFLSALGFTILANRSEMAARAREIDLT